VCERERERKCVLLLCGETKLVIPKKRGMCVRESERQDRVGAAALGRREIGTPKKEVCERQSVCMMLFQGGEKLVLPQKRYEFM